MNDIERVHLLALIFMQPLDLNIEDGICFKQSTFHFFPHRPALFFCCFIAPDDPVLLRPPPIQQLLQLCCVLLYAVTDLRLSIHAVNSRLQDKQPSAEGDAICFIVEFSG